jgi:putative PIN family toxin of toxin-antitoxin system
MSGKRRYVLDASVIVSALLFEQSIPGQAFQTAHCQGEILLSNDVIAELASVLTRKKFDRYLTQDEREEFLQTLVRESTILEITEPVQACRDPKDDKYLALAVNGQAACLITGDRDLLTLVSYRGIPILTPGQFVGEPPTQPVAATIDQ